MAEETTTNKGDAGSGDSDIAQVRAKAELTDETLSENARLKQELAFERAKIPVTEGVGKLVFESFKPEEGQEVTAEAVVAYAAQYGITPTEPAPATTEGGNAGDGQQQQQQEQANASTTATAEERQFFETSSQVGNATDGEGEDGDPYATGYDNFTNAMASGVPRKEAAHEMVGTIFAAAAKGDPRVIRT